jgi:hypothetical protein
MALLRRGERNVSFVTIDDVDHYFAPITMQLPDVPRWQTSAKLRGMRVQVPLVNGAPEFCLLALPKEFATDRRLTVLNNAARNGAPVLLRGVSGCGKASLQASRMVCA